jgi:hypothetical protein
LVNSLIKPSPGGFGAIIVCDSARILVGVPLLTVLKKVLNLKNPLS